MAFPFPITRVDPRRSINDILQEYPAAVATLSVRGIDSCCRGDESLAAAASALGLDAATLANEIIASAGGAPPPKPCSCGGNH